MNEEGALGEPPRRKAHRHSVLGYRESQAKIKTYRTESLFHLEYLVKRKNPSLPILERYAYYTAHVDPKAAVPIFYRLLENTKPRFRQYYNLDFASLLLHVRRCREAQTLLNQPWPKSQRRKRSLLMSALPLCDGETFARTTLSHLRSVCAITPSGFFQKILPQIARYTLLRRTLGRPLSVQTVETLCPRLKEIHTQKRFSFLLDALKKEWGLTLPKDLKKRHLTFTNLSWLQKRLEHALPILALHNWHTPTPQIMLTVNAQGALLAPRHTSLHALLNGLLFPEDPCKKAKREIVVTFSSP